MEIDINKLSIVHLKDKVVKIFDDSDECIKFADDFKNKYGIKLSCDPLYSFLICIENKGYFKGFKGKK